MGYKRIQKVTSMMIDYKSAKLLDYVQTDEEKVKAWNCVLGYFEKAREKGAEIHFQIPEELSKPAQDAVSGMIESIDDGIDKFWKMVDKNTKARNQALSNENELTTGRPVVTTGQPVVTIGDQWSTNISKLKEKGSKIKENYQYSTGSSEKGFNKHALLMSDRAEEYKRVLSAMKDYGYSINESHEESIAQKMNECYIDEDDVYDALRICQNKNNGDIRYFFAILKHKVEGWAN